MKYLHINSDSLKNKYHTVSRFFKDRDYKHVKRAKISISFVRSIVCLQKSYLFYGSVRARAIISWSVFHIINMTNGQKHVTTFYFCP